MLSFLSSIYGRIMDLRNLLYDRGVFDTFDLGARTISIGNITAGGTGKTPLVAYVAEILAERGERVCILTRGYGRKNVKMRVLVSDGEKIFADPSEAGDEPFELAQKLIGKAIVIADADRVGAGEWAKRRFGVTAFVLDDGFQHRRVKRDVDIVCIDATDPFGSGKMLPAGRLREPKTNLSRAGIIVITRPDLVSEISDLRSQISEFKPNAVIFTAKNEAVSIVGLEEFDARTKESQSRRKFKANDLKPRERKALAFCGIGNPENFFEQLRQESYSIASTQPFADHHVYTQRDIENVEMRARENGAEILITTAKDGVKLSELKFNIPCFVVEIKVVVEEASAFAARL